MEIKESTDWRSYGDNHLSGNEVGRIEQAGEKIIKLNNWFTYWGKTKYRVLVTYSQGN